jgi:hypothetical protein
MRKLTVLIALFFLAGTTAAEARKYPASNAASISCGAVIEDFEDTSFNFTVGGAWELSRTAAHSGVQSFKSAMIKDNETSETVVTVPTGARQVRFRYKVSSEGNYDFFRFLIGSTQQISTSGEVGWVQSPLLELGPTSTITFRYTKDGSLVRGSDAAWIDDVEFIVPDAARMVWKVEKKNLLKLAVQNPCGFDVLVFWSTKGYNQAVWVRSHDSTDLWKSELKPVGIKLVSGLELSNTHRYDSDCHTFGRNWWASGDTLTRRPCGWKP